MSNDLKLTVNEAHKNYENIVNLRKSINRNFWTLVQQLKIARDSRSWALLNYETWSSFLAQPEIDLNQNTVTDYIYIFTSISNALGVSDMSDKMIDFDIDIGKLKIISPRITKENATELLEKTKTLSRSDLIKTLRDEISVPMKSLPNGKFNVIYADPAWQYSNSGISGSAENHYPTMATEDICALKVPSDENAVLFLWVTNPLITDALRVCEAWGFEYKTNMVWVKDRAGQGFYTKGQHELLFIAVKGQYRPDESIYVKSVVNEPRQEHSTKPKIFYEIIEKLYPTSYYLELFARHNDRPKWTTWGNPAVQK